MLIMALVSMFGEDGIVREDLCINTLVLVYERISLASGYTEEWVH